MVTTSLIDENLKKWIENKSIGNNAKEGSFFQSKFEKSFVSTIVFTRSSATGGRPDLFAYHIVHPHPIENIDGATDQISQQLKKLEIIESSHITDATNILSNHLNGSDIFKINWSQHKDGGDELW